MNDYEQMNLHTTTHENLKRVISELKSYDDMNDAPRDVFEMLFLELINSNLIAAGDIHGDEAEVAVASVGKMGWMALFTDMDEYRKAFPDFDIGAHKHPFKAYVEHMIKCGLDGMVINIKGDCFVMPKDGVEGFENLPEYDFSTEGAYTSDEMKNMKDSIDNSSLEEFIQNPANTGRYEELFSEISSSTMLTLRLTREDCSHMMEDGIISMENTGPLGVLYLDRIGGKYAAAFTSDEKMLNVKTDRFRYSQIVDFAQMSKMLLAEDLDGMVINPGDENIILVREVLMEFEDIIYEKCYSPKMNSSVFYMFPV